MSTALLKLADVGKSFPGGVEALSGIDLTVQRGEFIALLGASGCGKSTLLRIIAGLAEPTFGSVRWSAERKTGGLGFVFQDATLMPWASVADNVYLPLRLAGLGRAEAEPRIAEALAAVDLNEFAAAFPRELSGGDRKSTRLNSSHVSESRMPSSA